MVKTVNNQFVEGMKKYDRMGFKIYIKDHSKSHIKSTNIKDYFGKKIIDLAIDRYKGMILIEVE